MTISQILLHALSLIEMALLALVIVFFIRLKRSENLLRHLQENQDQLLQRLDNNVELEQELMRSFEQRQEELIRINDVLSDKADELRTLIEKAEELGQSPRIMREIIQKGHESGKNTIELAKATGLSVDEVELILMEYKQ